MMSELIPLLLFEEEANKRREQNFRQFVSTISPSSSRTQQANNGSVALDKALLHLLETGRFSDMQFLVGANEYCFNCHKAIVGGRSEVLAIAMEQRWAENNVVSNKSVVRLPETDVDAFRVFLKVRQFICVIDSSFALKHGLPHCSTSTRMSLIWN